SVLATAFRGVGLVDALDPLVRRADRQHERGAHAQQAELGALHRQALAEEDDQEEGDRGDERDQPGVLEEPPGGVLAAFCVGEEHQPFISESSSRAMLLRLRYTSRTSARPTPTSAAATAMMNRANTLPSMFWLNRLKASRLMFTELRISSMLISTMTAFLRA